MVYMEQNISLGYIMLQLVGSYNILQIECYFPRLRFCTFLLLMDLLLLRRVRKIVISDY